MVPNPIPFAVIFAAILAPGAGLRRFATRVFPGAGKSTGACNRQEYQSSRHRDQLLGRTRREF
jgi:hypothetical protein